MQRAPSIAFFYYRRRLHAREDFTGALVSTSASTVRANEGERQRSRVYLSAARHDHHLQNAGSEIELLLLDGVGELKKLQK